MRKAYDMILSDYVDAESAAQSSGFEPYRYECACCWEEVHLCAADSRNQVTHFRHRSGNNKVECENYLGNRNAIISKALSLQYVRDKIVFYFFNTTRMFSIGVKFSAEEISAYEQSGASFQVRNAPFTMNALVSDQLSRFRKIVGGDKFREIFTKDTHATRIPHFGMYTGRTPYSGEAKSASSKELATTFRENYLVDGNADADKQRCQLNNIKGLKSINKYPARFGENGLEVFIDNLEKNIHKPSPYDAEFITRFEMQNCPPDILITNYSMLEYMLMRQREANIWNTTKEWLDSSADNEVIILTGNRPVYSFKVVSGNKPISQFNDEITVSVPYTIRDGEDPEAIVIYYINAHGQPEMIKDCIYNAETGRVTFTTNHFSNFAVGYNKISYDDVDKDAWYNKAVIFAAGRGITEGIGNNCFGPEVELTRGQFIVMLMKAYGIDPDISPTDNFVDAGNTFYTGYLAVAKRLGISAGIGNKMYGPENEITRQEMVTLLYNTLKLLGKLPTAPIDALPEEFFDVDKISIWAREAMTLFVRSGIISGSGGSLNPDGVANRAQMVQVLYNLRMQ